MKVAKNRNYWLAFFGSLTCTALVLPSCDTVETLIRLTMTDLNVAIWLYVAWLFDDQRTD